MNRLNEEDSESEAEESEEVLTPETPCSHSHSKEEEVTEVAEDEKTSEKGSVMSKKSMFKEPPVKPVLKIEIEEETPEPVVEEAEVIPEVVEKVPEPVKP